MAKRTNGGSSPIKESQYKSHYLKRSAKVKKRLEQRVESLRKGKHKNRKYELKSETANTRGGMTIKYHIVRVK